MNARSCSLVYDGHEETASARRSTNPLRIPLPCPLLLRLFDRFEESVSDCAAPLPRPDWEDLGCWVALCACFGSVLAPRALVLLAAPDGPPTAAATASLAVLDSLGRLLDCLLLASVEEAAELAACLRREFRSMTASSLSVSAVVDGAFGAAELAACLRRAPMSSLTSMIASSLSVSVPSLVAPSLTTTASHAASDDDASLRRRWPKA